MERQRELMVGADRLSDLPDSILLHILSMLLNNKEVVRTSVLSVRWQFLWKFVPTSLNFNFPISDNENVIRDYLVSIHRELYYWRLANIEDHELGLLTNNRRYEFPQFAYTTASLRNLVLWNCRLNPFGNVNWSSLISLSIVYMGFTDGVMENVLSGCPNLDEIRVINVASLVTAVLCFDFDFEDEEQNLEKEFRFFKELLHSVAHVENLNLGSWVGVSTIKPEVLSGVEFEQLDFPGICCFLQSSVDLETLVIDWYDVESGDLLSRYINEDKQIRRFESHNFNGSFPYLKTIKILNFYGFMLPLHKSSQAIQDPLCMLQLTFLIDDFGPLPFVNIATYLTSRTFMFETVRFELSEKAWIALVNIQGGVSSSSCLRNSVFIL
ncbi:hypothetical protein KY290_007817 [Solanum tuberosum]|uniref:F-box family protein n=1 Tax=Solanum tuberosum TaxID=4113 RepID=A0ABQ7W6M6_SOLTU|nr:hypothetical protein KY290_007817 [Solanum tuberosum]